MNQKLVNIALLVLFLSGCNTTKQSNGEPLNKNAPLFIRPNTNANVANKAPEPTPTPSKSAVVNFNAEKYVMVKESDLNKLIIQKTNEALRNKQAEVKPITNEKEVNKRTESPGSPVGSSPTEISVQSEPSIPTVETVQLEPIKNTNNPLLSLVVTFSAILGFILLIGYLFFFKGKNEKSNEATPQPPEPVAEAEKKNENGSTPAA